MYSWGNKCIGSFQNLSLILAIPILFNSVRAFYFMLLGFFFLEYLYRLHTTILMCDDVRRFFSSFLFNVLLECLYVYRLHNKDVDVSRCPCVFSFTFLSRVPVYTAACNDVDV